MKRASFIFYTLTVRVLAVFTILYAVLFGFFSQYAFAAGEFDLRLYMSSLSNLPTYCQYRIAESHFRKDFTDGNGKEHWPPRFAKERIRWINHVGSQNWNYVHHYCFGIKEYMESSTLSSYKNASKKNYKLQRALEEFNFMRNAQIRNFPFMYDLYRYEANIYLQLGNSSKAQWAIEQSRKYRK